jgi:hypothetical protein
MAYEVEAILRFEGVAPEAGDIEETLDCIVVEWLPEEV